MMHGLSPPLGDDEFADLAKTGDARKTDPFAAFASEIAGRDNAEDVGVSCDRRSEQGLNGKAKTVPAEPVTLTRFTNANDETLTKKLSVAPDNSLLSDGSAMVMNRGTGDRVVVHGVAGLGALIEQLKPSQALALGALRADLPDKVSVTTIKKLRNGTPRLDLITRTNDNLVYLGPAFTLLDYDSKGLPPAVAAELTRLGGFWGALQTVLPAFNGVANLTRCSTSAGLSRSDTGAEIKGSDGIHIYIIIQDGADAERFLRALHDRCWLARLGWMMVGKAGQILERSIVDRMVGQSGRLVFEGGPVLVAPLVQDKQKRRPVAVDGAMLDTRSACPPLTIVENSRLAQIKAKDRDRVKPEEVKAKEKSVTEKSRKLRAAQPNLTEKAARAIVLRQYEGILRPDVVLPWDDGRSARGCRLRTLLRQGHDPRRRHALDPLVRPRPHDLCAALRRRRDYQGDERRRQGRRGEGLHQPHRRRRPRRPRDRGVGAAGDETFRRRRAPDQEYAKGG
jgi:hypothetical protein